MKRILSIVLSFAYAVSASDVFTVYVDPGERIEVARQKIRDARKAGTLKANERANVVFRPGVHTVSVRYEIGPQDGGASPEGMVTYKAEKPGTVFIRGGKSLPRDIFKPASGMDGVLVADVSKYLITPPKAWPNVIKDIPSGPWLYLDGEPQTLARWPNGEWATFTNTVDQGLSGPGAFVFEGDRAKRWNVEKGLWLTGYWKHDWADAYLRVKSFDSVSNVVRFAGRSPFGIGGQTWGGKARRFYAVNLLEELDAPGEWFLDREKNLLYFKPVPGKEGKELVLASFDGTLFKMLAGAENVKIENLNFEFSHSATPAIEIERGKNIKIENCTFSCLAGMAIKAYGTSIEIADGKFRNIGGTVIRIDGGDRKLLRPARNLIKNCDIGFYGRFKQTFQPAVGIYGCGSAMRNCFVHDGPYIAVWYYGNDHLIADNEFTRVVLEAGDSAALYSGRDASSWGNVVFGNLIHDLGMNSELSAFRMGVYLDDCDCGDRIVGNTFRTCGHAVFIGGGNGNIVANNLMEDTPEAVHLDVRGMHWKLYTAFPGGHNWWHNCNKDFDYRMPPWSLAYPELPALVDDNPHKPWMNTFKGNAIVRCKSALGFKFKNPDILERIKIENNTIVTNDAKGVLPQKIGFADAEKTVVESPDGKTGFAAELDIAGRLSWRMTVDGKEAIALSPLGITADGRDFGRLVIPCKATVAKGEKETTATIPLKDLVDNEVVVNLDVRVSNGVVMWRWRSAKEGKHKVHGEFTVWNAVDGCEADISETEIPEGWPKAAVCEYGNGVKTVLCPLNVKPRDAESAILSPWRVTKIKKAEGSK